MNQFAGRYWRLDSDFGPLVWRGVVLVVASVLALGSYHRHDQFDQLVAFGLVPALLLLVIGALGAISVPPGPAQILQSGAETFGAAAVIGGLGKPANLFVASLLVPVATAGIRSGLRPALLCAGIAWTTMVGWVTIKIGSLNLPQSSTESLAYMLPLLLLVPLLSSWANSVLLRTAAPPEPAYTDAHRLLSELHVVARQLSLGLDPRTLAEALVEETTTAMPGTSGGVVVRSPAGRIVPLVGQHPGDDLEEVVLEAIATGERTWSERADAVVLPVQMGERVVAALVLSGAARLSGPGVDAAGTAVTTAGPRLASALLFDDVRRLATDDERMRLAREIHDGIAQDMASVGYLIDDIASGTDGETADRLKGLREHLQKLVTELRLSIFDLRTGVDESEGLAHSASDYVKRVGAGAGLTVHVTTQGDTSRRLPVGVEFELLRIVQEAMTNVRKHARASTVWLAVDVDPPRARITLADDGRGIQGRHSGLTPALGIRLGGMGITGMHERARRIGAKVRVANREEGEGTVVEVVLDPGSGRSAGKGAGSRAEVLDSAQHDGLRTRLGTARPAGSVGAASET